MNTCFNVLLALGKENLDPAPSTLDCSLIHRIRHTHNLFGPVLEIWVQCRDKVNIYNLIGELLLTGAILKIGLLDGNIYPGYLLFQIEEFPNPALQGKIIAENLKPKQPTPEWFIEKGFAKKVIIRKGKIILHLEDKTPACWFFEKGLRILKPFTTPPKLSTIRPNQTK